MTKKLTKSESEEITRLAKEFASFWEVINERERELTRIDERKTEIQTEMTNLLNRINEVRSEEKKFTDKIKKKYGNCEINMETFEVYPITEDQTGSQDNEIDI
jgi:peptidoglycan hydrolase CwlO-like protein